MTTLRSIPLMRTVWLLPISIAVSGCTTFSKDGGMSDVRAITKPFIQQEIAWPRSPDEQAGVAARVDALLQGDIDADNAVQIALLNNKGLQAALFEMGISEADFVQAGRLPNPRFSMLYARNDGDYKIEQMFTFNIFSLLTLPKVREIEQINFEKTKRQVAEQVIRLAYQTRQAYFKAVTARQMLDYSEQVQQSAEASAELARRMVIAGNWNQLELAREQGYLADAVQDALEARKQVIASHESLARQLGVHVDQLNIKKRLPDLPSGLIDAEQFGEEVFQSRLDIQTARLNAENMAKRLGLTKATRLINVLEMGPARVLEGRRGEPYKKGFEISFELPLFDWGGAKVARAEAQYMQSLNEAAFVASNAQSQIREAYGRYQASYDIARQYAQEIVPLRKKILDEKLLRYNGMLTSPFELFADARAQVSSVKTYIEKLNEFWLAETELQMTRIGNLSLSAGGE